MSGNRSSRGSDKRLREIILYVLALRRRKHTTLPALLSLLFLIDRQAYRELGRSITGKAWRAMPVGPVPSRFRHVTGQMVRDGEIRIVPAPPRDSHGRFAASQETEPQ